MAAPTSFGEKGGKVRRDCVEREKQFSHFPPPPSLLFSIDCCRRLCANNVESESTSSSSLSYVFVIAVHSLYIDDDDGTKEERKKYGRGQRRGHVKRNERKKWERKWAWACRACTSCWGGRWLSATKRTDREEGGGGDVVAVGS